jgi:hypothetical protein
MDPHFVGIYRENDVNYYIINSTKRQDLYKAIQMDNSPRNPVFKWSSRAVTYALALESMVDWTPWVEMDYRLKSLASTNLWDQPRKIYYVYDTTTSSYEVGGY